MPIDFPDIQRRTGIALSGEDQRTLLVYRTWWQEGLSPRNYMPNDTYARAREILIAYVRGDFHGN
ncbi:MAG: hypothetical protein HYY37_04985 [Candidatus Aenigmarchaeota archaeon]|nr:hypothetical protein [Candidatus Aenigmarchaeota archaeon]